MKKSQRARLAALLAQDAATLTAEEKSELSTLQALAAQHTDATQDVDDAAPAPAASKEPVTLKTVIAAAFLSVRNRNSVAADLATARAQITALTTERDTARSEATARATERDTARASVSALESTIASIAAFFGVEAKDLQGQPAASAQKLIEQKVSSLVLEQMASLGVPQGDLPAPKANTPSAKDKTLSLAEFHALSHADRMTFSVNGGRISG